MKVRILSIDGGGIRGIIPGTILSEIESLIKVKTNNDQAKLVDYIDFIAGTSTGGILAAGLLTPDPEISGRPLYSASEVLDFYHIHGPQIFKKSIWHRIKTIGGLRDAKYSNGALKSALRNTFFETTLSTLLRPSIITAYDIYHSTARFFGSHKSRQYILNDHLVTEIAQATSAAPTFFEPALITTKTGEQLHLIDGGVFANNPALCAYTECRKLAFHGIIHPTAKDMFLVSIGTGSNNKSYTYNRTKKWGAINWIRPLINIMMAGNAETVTHQLKLIFDAGNNAKNFIRLEPFLVNASAAMDDASSKNLAALHADARKFIRENHQLLDEIVDKLVQNY